MTRAQLHRRLRSRLHPDERGFTLIETVMAITVIFASLTTLAYTATIGFRYVAVSRDRVQATAYANRVMEEIRALPYAEVTKGLAIEDLSGDTDVKPCDVGYCFGDRQLVAASFPGGRETSPLYPHIEQVSDNGIDLTRRVYVTNGDDDPLTQDEEPFHVTVIVTWASASLQGATRQIRMETDFYSPKGCVSSATHPFAAPCQPFFYGRATVPTGGITFEGTFYSEALDVAGGLVTLPGLQATVQQEQTTATGAFAQEGEAILVDSLGTQEADGAESMRVDTDTDPSTADVGLTAGYAEQTADDAAVTWAGQTADGDWAEIAPIAWGGDRYQASSSAETTGAETYKCPPGTATVASTKLRLPCAGARLQKLIHARVRLELDDQWLGSAFLARLNAPSTGYSSTSSYWWQAKVERESTSDDGRIDAYASRYIGIDPSRRLPEQRVRPAPVVRTRSSPPGWGTHPTSACGSTTTRPRCRPRRATRPARSMPPRRGPCTTTTRRRGSSRRPASRWTARRCRR